MSTYQIGDVVRLTATFTNAAGANTDPTARAWTVKEPDGTDNNPSDTKSEDGVFYIDFTITQSGFHVWKAVGTGGDGAGTVDGSFYVSKADV